MQQMEETRVDPWVRKSPWRRKWQPTPVFLPGQFHGQRSPEGYSPWGCRVRHTAQPCLLVCFWSVIALQLSVSSYYITWWSICFQKITMINLVTISQYTVAHIFAISPLLDILHPQLIVLQLEVCISYSPSPIFLFYPTPTPWQPPVCSLYLWLCFCFVFSFVLYKGNHTIIVFLWLILLSIITARSINIVKNSKISFFLMAKHIYIYIHTHIHMCIYTISSMSICLLMALRLLLYFTYCK